MLQTGVFRVPGSSASIQVSHELPPGIMGATLQVQVPHVAQRSCAVMVGCTRLCVLGSKIRPPSHPATVCSIGSCQGALRASQPKMWRLLLPCLSHTFANSRSPLFHTAFMMLCSLRRACVWYVAWGFTNRPQLARGLHTLRLAERRRHCHGTWHRSTCCAVSRGAQSCHSFLGSSPS